MNVYDFDGTIYDGDSSIDFFKFCFNENKRCIKVLPRFLISIVLYLLKIKEKEYMKSCFFAFIKYFDNLEDMVNKFWSLNECKIKDWYLEVKSENDIIISASPEFLLSPICKKLNIALIATKVNTKTGELVGKNCHGKEKVIRFNSRGKIENFYSDSLSDMPLKEISKNAFIVKGERLIPWQEYKESLLKRLVRIFISRDFIVFVFIGLINVFNGVALAYLYNTVFSNPIVSYVFGFVTSLTIAYILNSVLNFRKKLSFKSYFKYVVNNIPNFLIQIFSVVVFLNILNYSKFISYLVSATIAVPVTFILIKLFVFNKDNGKNLKVSR